MIRNEGEGDVTSKPILSHGLSGSVASALDSMLGLWKGCVREGWRAMGGQDGQA